MIGRVYRGSRPGGLLRYLYGPGRSNEHINPHLVASWDGNPRALEPITAHSGRVQLGALTALLEQPLAFAEAAPHMPVWHCALRAAPDDRTLNDEEWADIAAEVLDRTGIAPRGDDGACRWVAVRHAEDHIHVVAILARDDGRAVRLWRDFPKLREACRAVEARYGLHETSAADGTVPPRPTRAETEKATRRAAARTGGRPPRAAVVDPPGPRAGRNGPAPGGRRPLTPRERLRVAVRRAAVASDDAAEFLDRLRLGGVIVKERRGERGELTGYAVALPDDLAAGGVPVFYGGGKLAADLSLPRLQWRWAGRTAQGDELGERPRGDGRQPGHNLRRGEGAPLAEALRTAADAADGAATRLREVGRSAAADTARAAADALTAAGQLTGGKTGACVAAAADVFERAAQQPRRTPCSPGTWPAATRLSLAAAALTRLGACSGGVDRQALVTFLLAIGALCDAITSWHAQTRRDDQEAAARATARLLHEAAAEVRTWNLNGVVDPLRPREAREVATGRPQVFRVERRDARGARRVAMVEGLARHRAR